MKFIKYFEKINNDFEIGDRVVIDEDCLSPLPEDTKVYLSKKIGKIGIITNVINNSYPYQVDWDGVNGYHNSKEIKLINKKRIINLEDDPFGEDSLGYIQEGIFNKYTEDDIFKIAKKYSNKLNDNMSVEDRYSIWNLDYTITWDYKNLFFYVGKKKSENHYEFSFHNDALFTIKSYMGMIKGDETHTSFRKIFDNHLDLLSFLNKCGLKIDKEKLEKYHKERKLNLEDDPFGEDNWGFVQESRSFNEEEFKNQEIIIFRDLINKLGLNGAVDYLQDYIGRDCFYISDSNYLYGEDRNDSEPIKVNSFTISSSNGIHVNTSIGSGDPRGMVFFKPRIRKLNLEEDPLGEENWGYVQENINGINRGDIAQYNQVDLYSGIGIKVKHRLEMEELIMLLDQLGFKTTRNMSLPKLILRDAKYFWLHDDKKVTYSVSDKIHYPDYIIVSAEDYMDKFKKKLNLKDDPFGEDNWGFVQESRKFNEEEFSGSEIIIFKDLIEQMGIIDAIDYLQDYIGIDCFYITDDNLIYGAPPMDSSPIKVKSFTRVNSKIKVDTTIGSGTPKGMVFLVPLKSRKRIINLEDDPLGEENWGFVQENIGSDPFKKLIDYWEVRSRRTANKFNLCVEIENESQYNLLMSELEIFGYRWGDKSIPTQIKYDTINYDEMALYILIYENKIISWVQDDVSGHYIKFDDLKLEDRRTKILNPKEDPFGEDNWGFVQEQRKENPIYLYDIRFDFDDVEERIKIAEFLSDYGPIFAAMDVFDPEYINNPPYDCFIWDEEEEEFTEHQRESCEGMKSMTYEDMIKLKKRNRILNLKEDPFGEDNWGFVQEKIDNPKDFNDQIIIRDKHSEFFYDVVKLIDFIKKELTGKLISFVTEKRGDKVRITDIALKFNDIPVYGSAYIEVTCFNGHKYYINALDPIYYYNKKRILNPIDDPFGEDNWGHVQENNILDDDILKNIAIRFNNGEEFEKLMEFIEKNTDFTWANGLKPTKIIPLVRNILMQYPFVIFPAGASKILYRTNEPGSLMVFGVEDLLSNKKRMRKLNLDDDPLGEENWGFVQEKKLK